MSACAAYHTVSFFLMKKYDQSFVWTTLIQCKLSVTSHYSIFKPTRCRFTQFVRRGADNRNLIYHRFVFCQMTSHTFFHFFSLFCPFFDSFKHFSAFSGAKWWFFKKKTILRFFHTKAKILSPEERTLCRVWTDGNISNRYLYSPLYKNYHIPTPISNHRKAQGSKIRAGANYRWQ